MNETLTRQFFVDSRDTDLHGMCRPSALLGMLQQMATEHAAYIGLGRGELLKKYHCVWLLARTWYRLDKPIYHDQQLTITTWSRGVTGAVSYRDFDIFVNGERAGEAVTSWVLADIDNRSLLRIHKIPEVVNVVRPETVKMKKLSRLPMPKEMTELTTRRVQYSDTDINGHMNNTRYVDVACDSIEFETMQGSYLAEVQISYSRECFAGSLLHILGKEEDGVFYVRGAAADGTDHFDTVLRFAKIPK